MLQTRSASTTPLSALTKILSQSEINQLMAEVLDVARERVRAKSLPLIELDFRGGASQLLASTAGEAMLSGPAETGKTIGSLVKLHNLATKYPNSQWAIMRKTYASTVASVVQSFKRKVLTLAKFDVEPYGGERPQWFDYPNGSRIWVGGMDNPSKVLSQELDGVYVNQCEELELEDWETLSTRTTGRAGNVPYPQLWGDCNPGPPTHWILQRRNEKKLAFFESRHEDNPSLFRPDGTITEQGKRTLEKLGNLTGVRLQRLRFGKWVQAEGTVYEGYDAAVHLIDRFEIPGDWPRYRVIDFGYVNPFVCQWWAADHDGRLYRYREIYMTKRTVATHAQLINALSSGESYVATIADHDAEDRATLAENGIHTTPADKDISTGIQSVADRLKAQGDGRARIFFLRDSLVEADPELIEARKPTCTEHEMDVYVWPKASDGKAVKEVPVKEYDHGMDSMRYLVKHVDGGRGDGYGYNPLSGYRG